ncbi:MAG: hypothetical protein OQJ81_04325 [Melioribacteraceae bacterium]|nr:hypothetical protein [Melioribacteraceae bacterium]
MNIEEIKWSDTEKKLARSIFEKALNNEMSEIEKVLKEKIEEIKESKDIWEIEHFLTTRRKFIEAKYDYRYSRLLVVFGTLLKEGYLSEADLTVLDEEKQMKIKHFAE